MEDEREEEEDNEEEVEEEETEAEVEEIEHVATAGRGTTSEHELRRSISCMQSRAD